MVSLVLPCSFRLVLSLKDPSSLAYEMSGKKEVEVKKEVASIMIEATAAVTVRIVLAARGAVHKRVVPPALLLTSTTHFIVNTDVTLKAPTSSGFYLTRR